MQVCENLKDSGHQHKKMNKYKRLEWTSEQVSKFWDYESKFPENYFSKQVGSNLAAYIKNSFPDKKTILDFGCGPGFLMEYG